MNTQTMCNIDAVMWLMTCICIHAAAPAAAGANIMNREHTQCGALYHASVIEQWASFKNFASRLSPRNMRWRSQRIDRIGASNVSEWPRPTWIDRENIFRTGDIFGGVQLPKCHSRQFCFAAANATPPQIYIQHSCGRCVAIYRCL